MLTPNEDALQLIHKITEQPDYDRTIVLTALYHWQIRNNQKVIDIHNMETDERTKTEIIFCEFIQYMFPNIKFFFQNIHLCMRKIKKFIDK